MTGTDRKRALMVGLAFIVFVAGAAWSYMSYSETVYEREQVFDYSYTYSGAHSLAAYVSVDNPIYETGSDLSDMAGYYYSVSPRCTVEFDLTFTATRSDTSIEATARTTLVVSEVDDDGVPFWSQAYVLSEVSASGTDSLVMHDSVVVDAQAYDAEIVSIQESLGASPGRVSGLLTTVVSLDGIAGSVPIELSDRFDIPFTFNEEYYTAIVPTAKLPQTQKFYVPRTVARSKSLSDIYLQLAVAAVGLIALLALLATGKKEEGDVDAAKFKDWISFGVYPRGDWDKEVYIPKLKDLVDIAIDCHKRVIYDTSKDVFFVIDGRVLYYLVTKKPAEPQGQEKKKGKEKKEE
jgi:hypothetical protein